MSEPRTFPVVEVEWETDWGARWSTSPCLTIGYLVQDDEQCVKLIQSRHNLRVEPDIADMWAEAITIPRAVVRTLTVIRP